MIIYPLKGSPFGSRGYPLRLRKPAPSSPQNLVFSNLAHAVALHAVTPIARGEASVLLVVLHSSYCAGKLFYGDNTTTFKDKDDKTRDGTSHKARHAPGGTGRVPLFSTEPLLPRNIHEVGTEICNFLYLKLHA